ncbi:MAG: GNAT family N-acyltransferase [Steroidobacteraceae bacterium]
MSERMATTSTAQISLGRLFNRGGWRDFAGRALAPLADRLLGISTIDTLYRNGAFSGLEPFDFVARALEVLEVTGGNSTVELALKLPRSGPVLIVCNHPYGAIEALLIADAVRRVRRDLRFLANEGLKVFPELSPLIIGTDPLEVTPRNLRSIRECEAQLEAGGVLALFPAGLVSRRSPDGSRLVDGAWNRIVGRLALRHKATLLPVFFHGGNSRLFHRVGELLGLARMALLPREMLRLRGRNLRFTTGRPLPPDLWRQLDAERVTAYARLMTFLMETPVNDRSAEPGEPGEPLAPPVDASAMETEITALPRGQRLLEFKHYSVYHAHADQMPAVMRQITRERERVFRSLAEGSGAAVDGDDFDRTYVQLFVWDQRERAIVGAYRLGRTDLLRRDHGAAGVYLSQVFRFESRFYEREDGGASLELGRSFVVPEHQKSFHALYLLWQGIGRYLVANPRYRRLYGTVSLSNRFDRRAVQMLCDALVEPSDEVKPRLPLAGEIHPEWRDFLDRHGRPDLVLLSALFRGLDTEGKDVPVLLRHYHKLGARFHDVGVDPNFSGTPGLLLSVDVPTLGRGSVTTFLGAGADGYLAWQAGDIRAEKPRLADTVAAA